MKTEPSLNIAALVRCGEIDLESYSRSPGWVGYFSVAAASCRRQTAQNLVAEVLAQLDPTSAGTWVHFFGPEQTLVDEYEVDELDWTQLVRPLVDAGVVRVYEHFREVEGIRDVSRADPRLWKQTCVAVMDVSGLKGHIFLADRHGLVAYPHEDLGFGFIATTDLAWRRARELLQGHLARPCVEGRLVQAPDARA